MAAVRIYKKRRSDRTHVIYRLSCEDTGQMYVGVTAARFPNDLLRTVKYRWIAHCYKALNLNCEWRLHVAIREFDNWTYSILYVIRGKKQAHLKERELIVQLNPELNSQ